jgi:hypothetical protein
LLIIPCYLWNIIMKYHSSTPKSHVVSWFYKTFIPTTILVTIFHICTCDDVTLVNEKSIVSWKYLKSNKKCVFNVNFHTQGVMAHKKQFSNTKSIVKVETGIVTLISYRHYLKIVGNNKLWPDMQKEIWNIQLTKILICSHTLNGTDS